MGNQPSSSRRKNRSTQESAAERVKKVVGDVQEEFKRSVKKLDDDHPAAQLIDSVCGGAFFDDEASSRYRGGSSFYSEDAYSEEGSRTVSDDDTYDTRRSRMDKSVESQSYVSQSDYDSDQRNKRGHGRRNSFDTEDESRADPTSSLHKQPLASSFAKRCYFTKAGIGRTTQHYEGLTLTGNVVLMLASAMKLKGCPTICDEDLRRVEQTYPNQFSRLPDELLLSSGWRRISKYCHFSNKPIPDGVPFFHSKQRLHPSGGYYFLLANAVGMTRPMDVEPLNKDTLVLLETDFPSQCDAAPGVLIKDAEQWTLVNKFCFFSGGPINTEEDVYYQADFDGNPIFMLAFLSPSLTPGELYKLGETGEPSLKSVGAVREVESVYDLTDRDFDDLKLYHLGPCRALPQYILQPQAWTKILPPHFLAARQQAMIRAEDYMQRHGLVPSPISRSVPPSPGLAAEFQREIEEEGAFHDQRVLNNAHLAISPSGHRLGPMQGDKIYDDPATPRLDPPDDPDGEPPSLNKRSIDLTEAGDPTITSSPLAGDPSVHAESIFPGQYSNSSPPKEQPNSPDDERSALLISLGTPDDAPPASSYDPFAAMDHPQGEFGFKQGEQTTQGQQFYPDPAAATQSEAYNGEEKKTSTDADETAEQHLNYQMSQDSAVKSGEEDFIPIKREGYQLSSGPAGALSPQSITSEKSHTSPALRGAQEILKKNRRRRLEMAMKKPSTPSKTFEKGNDPSGEPSPEKEPKSSGNWDADSEVGSNATGSSMWSNDSGAGDKSSRRALILQMAKARMRNNKDSPVKASDPIGASAEGGTIAEEADSLGGVTETHTDLDLAGELD